MDIGAIGIRQVAEVGAEVIGTDGIEGIVPEIKVLQGFLNELALLLEVGYLLLLRLLTDISSRNEEDGYITDEQDEQGGELNLITELEMSVTACTNDDDSSPDEDSEERENSEYKVQAHACMRVRRERVVREGLGYLGLRRLGQLPAIRDNGLDLVIADMLPHTAAHDIGELVVVPSVVLADEDLRFGERVVGPENHFSALENEIVNVLGALGDEPNGIGLTIQERRLQVHEVTLGSCFQMTQVLRLGATYECQKEHKKQYFPHFFHFRLQNYKKYRIFAKIFEIFNE